MLRRNVNRVRLGARRWLVNFSPHYTSGVSQHVNFFGKHTTGIYVTGHCSWRRRWNSQSEQLRCWNVRNLGVARCLIGQVGRVNHESASSDIWMDAVALFHRTDLRRIPQNSYRRPLSRLWERLRRFCVTVDWSMNLVKLSGTATFWFCLNLICKILLDGKVLKDFSAAS